MELIRGGMKAPVATDWVSVADISGTGTAQADSAAIVIALNTLPDYSDILIDVEFKHRRIAGSGFNNASILYTMQTVDATVFANTQINHVVRCVNSTTSLITRQRKLRTNYDVAYGAAYVSSGGQDSVALKLCGQGSAVDTEWEITDIKARVIYTPL